MEKVNTIDRKIVDCVLFFLPYNKNKYICLLYARKLKTQNRYA